MPPRWTHVTINCSNLERSINFYTSLCGLSIVRDRRPEGRHNVWLGPKTAAGQDPVFVLVVVQDEVKARIDHFGFQCESREEVDRIAELAREQKHSRRTADGPWRSRRLLHDGPRSRRTLG